MLKFGALFAFLVCSLTLSTSVKAQSGPANGGTMTVRGIGKIELTPDFALVTIGTFAEGDELREVLDETSRNVAELIEFLRSEGISAGDIRTRAVQLRPDLVPRPQPPGREPVYELRGYSAANHVDVRVRELANLGLLMREGLDHGANRISGVEFGSSKLRRHQDEALSQAIKDSRRKAELMAAALDQTLGRPLQVVYPPARPTAYDSDMADLPYQPQSSEVPIAVGSISVEAAVDVVWAIDP